MHYLKQFSVPIWVKRPLLRLLSSLPRAYWLLWLLHRFTSRVLICDIESRWGNRLAPEVSREPVLDAG